MPPIAPIATPPQIATGAVTPAARRWLPPGPSRSYRGPNSACYSPWADGGVADLSPALEEDELSELESLELLDPLIEEAPSTSSLPTPALFALGCEPRP